MSGRATPKEQFEHAIVRPLKLLVLTPIVTLNSLYVAVTYGILYLLITTFSFVYTDQYGFSEGNNGLTFLPAGLGMVIGVLTFGALTDKIVQMNKAKGLPHRPELRLLPIITIPSGMALPIGLFIYGWTTHYGVHWIVPMIGVFIFSSGLMGVMVSHLPPKERTLLRNKEPSETNTHHYSSASRTICWTPIRYMQRLLAPRWRS